MSMKMSKAEREAFLAEVHVGVLSIAEEGRGPLTLPIWYSYEPGGDVVLSMARDSKKAELLRKAGRASLVAQTEDPPYKYVSVEGTVVVGGPADREKNVRPLAHRYLGQQMGDMYIEMTAAEQSTSVLVRLTPKRWLTVDYSKMAEEAGI